jgi:hypothetical protein
VRNGSKGKSTSVVSDFRRNEKVEPFFCKNCPNGNNMFRELCRGAKAIMKETHGTLLA